MRAGAIIALLACSAAHANPLPVETASSETGAESPELLLARGKQAYAKSDYDAAIKNLRGLLYPTVKVGAEPEMEARKLLALSYFFEREVPLAEQEFNGLLQLNSSFALDRDLDPPRAVEFLEDIRRRNKEKLDELAEQRRREALEREREIERQRREDEARRLREQKPVIIDRHIHDHILALNFLPFGVGQFQNGESRKGYVLLGSQLAFGLTSIALWSAVQYARSTWTSQMPSGPTHDQRVFATNLTIAQVVTGGLFWVDVIVGIVDGLLHYKPQVIDDPVKPAPSGGQSFSASPFAAPGGGGLSFKGVF